MACVDDTTILAYFRGELADGAVVAVASELDRCDSCRELMLAVASAWRTDEGDLGDLRRPGTTIGRYVVDRVLGSGAMGVVYAAHDPELDRAIALKVMARPTPQLAERFRREAQAMARLDHRNVVAVYDVGGTGPQAFVAMALIDGVTLREWLATPRSLPAICDAFAQAADGLAEAHRRGIVHRDFKPENVLVGNDGVVRVGDFGLAQLGAPVTFAAGSPSDGPAIATAGAGTPAYLAPEVLAGGTGSAKADQYSFWVAVHEALTGVRPTPPRATSNAAETHESDGSASAPASAPAPPRLPGAATSTSSRGPASIAITPSRLAAAVARGLSLDPAGRFASMDAVATELRAIVSAGKRRRAMLAAGAAFVLVGAVAAGAAWYARGAGAGDACASAGNELAASWSPVRAAEMRTAILSSQSPFAAFSADAAIQRLDRYAAAWRASATASCRATHVEHTQSSDLLDRRTSCLADRRVALSAVLERVPTAGANLIDLVEGLPSIAVCDDVETLMREPVPPRDLATTTRIAAVRAQIARAKTNFAAGTFEQGVAVAREAVAAARVTGHRPLVAEALEVYGGLTASAGKPEDALTILDEGLREAEASHAITAALAIRLRESELLGELGKYDEASRVAKLGLASAESDGYEKVAGDFHAQIGNLESDNDHNEVALAAYKQALAIYEKVQGPDGTEVGHVSGLIGLVEDDLGHHDDAIRNIQRSIDVAARVYGKAHPNYANAISNMASHTVSTEPARAYQLSQEAHAIRLAALAPDHPELAMSWSNLGSLQFQQHKFPEARKSLERALAIKLKVLGADSPSTGITHLTLAQTLFALHELDGSLDHAQQATAVFSKALGDEHPYTAKARAHVGATLLELGRAADAIAPLTAAIPHLSGDTYRFQLDLADALTRTHGDAARAHTLATTALADAKKHDDKVAIAQIEKFLRRR